MQIETLAIYGVGLLGGSIGLAARERGMARRIVGIGRSAERLAKAVDLGAIDQATTRLEEGCAGADAVVLCSTVSHITGILPRVAAGCKPAAVVTDVGSTKSTIVAAAERVFSPSGPFFVGSHPMAGSERSGVAHASADLFENACCIVTPTSATNAGATERVVGFWNALGSRVVELDPDRHDRLVSAISHLPHMAAVGVLLAAAREDENLDLLADLLGNGFRDTTRVAGALPEMWRDICLANREAIADDLNCLAERLLALAGAIRDGNAEAIQDFLEQARRIRRRLVPD